MLPCALQLCNAQACSLQAFEATEGHDIFEQRRQSKYSKNMATGVSMSDGMQEGVDRHVR